MTGYAGSTVSELKLLHKFQASICTLWWYVKLNIPAML